MFSSEPFLLTVMYAPTIPFPTNGASVHSSGTEADTEVFQSHTISERARSATISARGVGIVTGGADSRLGVGGTDSSARVRSSRRVGSNIADWLRERTSALVDLHPGAPAPLALY